MRTPIRHVIPLVALFVIFGAFLSRAEDSADAGRKIVKKYQDAVLTLKLVMDQSMSMSGRQSMKKEEKSEITGTVVDPSGLTVVSLAATDPADIMSKLMGQSEAGGPMKMNFESSLSDIKMVLPGGQEVPAKIVLRDKDLDLAFIMPSEKITNTMTSVDLTEKGSPSMLDDVVVIGRLGTVASRMPAVSLGHVAAIIEKPRKYYVIDHDMTTLGTGLPVFAVDGKFLGVVVIRSAASGARMGMSAMFSGMSNLGLLPVVVPADQILEASRQVPKEAAKTVSEEKPSAEKEAKPAEKTKTVEAAKPVEQKPKTN